jgi:hypothetical protein
MADQPRPIVGRSEHLSQWFMVDSRIVVVWLDDPRDRLAHAWAYVTTDGAWRSLCGLIAEQQTLTTPEDEFGRHLPCEIQLGELLAEHQDAIRQQQRAAMRRDDHWHP